MASGNRDRNNRLMMMKIIARLASWFALIGPVMRADVPVVDSDVVGVDCPVVDTVGSLWTTSATSGAGASVSENNRPIWSAGYNWKDAIRNCELIHPDTVRKSE